MLAAGTEVVLDAARRDEHVDDDHHRHGHGRDHREAGQRPPFPSECDAEHYGEDRHPDDRDVRGLELLVRVGQLARGEAVPGQRVEDAGRRVDGRVGVRRDRVADREEHEDPAGAPEDLAEVAPRIGAGGLRDEVVEAGPEHPRVRTEDVEEADRDRRAHDRARDRASRVLRLLAERRGRFEPDEREDREHHPLEDPAPVVDRVMRIEGLGVEVAGVRDQHPDGQAAEDRDLERAEDHAGRRRESDVPVGERQDEDSHQQEPDPPLAAVVPAHLALEDIRHRPAELEVEKRRHERLEADEEPRDQEARA